MKITKLGHMNVYSVMFDTKKQLCRDLVRPQAFYESQGFIGRVFTVEEFYDRWAIDHGTDYDTYWDGYNFPASSLDLFRSGEFKDLNYAEKALIEAIPPNSGGYVIGFHKDSKPETVFHETIHAVYFSSKSYKKRVDEIISKYSKYLGAFRKHLYNQGYSTFNVKDEINAYTVANYQFILDKGIKVPHTMYLELTELYKNAII